jgi:hypothetical protein
MMNKYGPTYLINLPEVLDENQRLLQPHPLLSQLAQQQLPQPAQHKKTVYYIRTGTSITSNHSQVCQLQ